MTARILRLVAGLSFAAAAYTLWLGRPRHMGCEHATAICDPVHAGQSGTRFALAACVVAVVLLLVAHRLARSRDEPA